jgi:hypothetical protein
MQLLFKWLQRTTCWPAGRPSLFVVKWALPRGIKGGKWRGMSKCKHTYCRVWNLNLLNINIVLKNTFLLSMLCSVLIITCLWYGDASKRGIHIKFCCFDFGWHFEVSANFSKVPHCQISFYPAVFTLIDADRRAARHDEGSKHVL